MVTFINWPTNQGITVWFNGSNMDTLQPGHAGSFTRTYTRILPQQQAIYNIDAIASGGWTNTKPFLVPCGEFPTPTPVGQPTNTPSPPDLVIVGPPSLISTPPIVAYKPVQFTVPITNVGDINVAQQFFVDIYLDPSGVTTTTIPISESDGYSAVSSLDGGQSRVITITSSTGFTNIPTPHAVYGFVDSLEQVFEGDETNNISQPPLIVYDVTPAPTPTPTPGGPGIDEISGGALTLGNDLILQFRARMTLIDEISGSSWMTESDINGFYAFTNVGTSTYTVTGCITIDGEDWFGSLTGLTAPNTSAHVIMLKQPCT